ncbi:MAG: hypothetical protein HGA61_00215 [Candidatus Moranbacteria bacterium]|nr:hypothetical protein [Candidatus Moranbacteria bacterium]
MAATCTVRIVLKNHFQSLSVTRVILTELKRLSITTEVYKGVIPDLPVRLWRNPESRDLVRLLLNGKDPETCLPDRQASSG